MCDDNVTYEQVVYVAFELMLPVMPLCIFCQQPNNNSIYLQWSTLHGINKDRSDTILW